MSRAFSLAGLLRVRELQEERAAAQLALANRAKLEAKVRRAAIEGTLAGQEFPDRATADVLDRHTHEVEAYTPTWRATVAARASISAMLKESTDALNIASVSAETAAQEWAYSKTRAAMIEKLRIRHLKELEAEDLREEQIVIDESALRRTLEVTP